MRSSLRPEDVDTLLRPSHNARRLKLEIRRKGVWEQGRANHKRQREERRLHPTISASRLHG